MWGIQRTHNDTICIVLQSDALTCSWISYQKQRIIIQAMRRIPFSSYEYTHGVIHNQTSIIAHIKKFLYDYRVSNIPISWLLDVQQVTEQFISLNTMTPTHQQIELCAPHNHQYDYAYMYQHDDGSTIFYLASIAYPIKLQIELTAIQGAFVINLVTTPTMALLQLYQYIKNTTFRHAQLHYDMNSCDHNLAQLFTHDILRRVAYIPQQQENILVVAYSLGLFLGAVNHEISH